MVYRLQIELKTLEQRVALIPLFIYLPRLANVFRGFSLHRVMFEVLSRCVQTTKRLVTLLAVYREGYANKNPKWFRVSALVLMIYELLHPVNVVQGRLS
jgi:hypothetical protein